MLEKKTGNGCEDVKSLLWLYFMINIITNPIDDIIHTNYCDAKCRVLIAVPFVSEYVKLIFYSPKKMTEKKIIIRLDDSDISSYNLEAIKYLLESGFEIRYLNDIHLKLYIFDDHYFISSSNLTKNGLINNIELSVESKVNVETVFNIFSQTWNAAANNNVDLKYIEDNWNRYLLLRKRSSRKPSSIEKPDPNKNVLISELNVEQLLTYIINHELSEFNEKQSLIYEANKIRNKRINEIIHDYSPEVIYVKEENHARRRNCLFYDLQYGPDVKLANAGLREYQFREAFSDSRFKNILTFLLPEAFNLSKWNLDDENDYYNLCMGIFDFKIRQCVESLPIRLVSFFYPNYFLPIFKINHLYEICSILGFSKSYENKGDSLFHYNIFLSNILRNIPADNYIKSKVLYSLLYCVKLYNSIKLGLTLDQHIEQNNYTEAWIIDYTKKGLTKLKALNLLN